MAQAIVLRHRDGIPFNRLIHGVPPFTGLESYLSQQAPPDLHDVHATCSTFIASMKRFASRIDASISRISTAISDSIEARFPLSEAIARALRLCLRNSTWS